MEGVPKCSGEWGKAVWDGPARTGEGWGVWRDAVTMVRVGRVNWVTA